MLPLFSDAAPYELLPFDGSALYYPAALSATEADAFLEQLLQKCPWQHDEVIMFGKKIITPRKYVWYADSGCSYTYSRTTKQPMPWNDTILALRTFVEQFTKQQFNACLLNLYHNGKEAMSWHSDNEPELGMQPIIASVSLGAERPFAFKHKVSKEIVKIILQHGSILLMSGNSQQAWWHSLPRSSKIHALRINATFRQIRTS